MVRVTRICIPVYQILVGMEQTSSLVEDVQLPIRNQLMLEVCGFEPRPINTEQQIHWAGGANTSWLRTNLL